MTDKHSRNRDPDGRRGLIARLVAEQKALRREKARLCAENRRLRRMLAGYAFAGYGEAAEEEGA